MIVLLDAAIISASAGDVPDAEAAITTLLKKAVVLHLMLGGEAGSGKRERTHSRTAKRRRTDAENKEQKNTSEVEMIERIAKDVICTTSPGGMSSDGAQEGKGQGEQPWSEHQQTGDMLDRIGDVCTKAIHLLAVLDLSSSCADNWRRAKHVLRSIANRGASTTPGDGHRADVSSRHRVASLRCHFPRFARSADGPSFGLRITSYLLGAAYYLRGKLQKAVTALDDAARGDFFEAHYLRGTHFALNQALVHHAP
jgi:hypothetical protein